MHSIKLTGYKIPHTLSFSQKFGKLAQDMFENPITYWCNLSEDMLLSVKQQTDYSLGLPKGCKFDHIPHQSLISFLCHSLSPAWFHGTWKNPLCCRELPLYPLCCRAQAFEGIFHTGIHKILKAVLTFCPLNSSVISIQGLRASSSPQGGLLLPCLLLL